MTTTDKQKTTADQHLHDEHSGRVAS